MIASLAGRLPYDAARTVPTRQQWPMSMLKFKDGTICTAIRMHPFDTFTKSTHELNNISRVFVDALHTLPPHAYVQIVFETGDDYDGLIDKFARRSVKDSHPLLQRCRQTRAEACRQKSKGSRPRVTFWIGWRGVLAKDDRVLKRFRRSVQKPPGKYEILQAGQALADVCEEFLARLSLAGLGGDALSETELIADVHRTISPQRYRQTLPPFHVARPQDLADVEAREPMLLERLNLSSRLATGHISFSDSMMRFRDPDLLQRVLRVSRYPEATEFGWLNPLLYAWAPKSPFRLVVTHLATDKTITTEDLGKRQKRLFSHVGERFYPPEDLVAAAQSHMRVVKELGHSNSRVFYSSIQVAVTGADPYDLEAATKRACSAFQEKGAELSTCAGEQLQAWQATLPGNGHVLWREQLGRTYQFLSRNAAHTTPCWLPSTDDNEADLLMQTRQNTWRGFNIGITEGREDASGVILGKTGSGKTFFFLMLIKLGVLDRGGHAILTDAKGPERSSLKPLCDNIGGDYRCLDSDSSCSFNPCPTFAQVFATGRYAAAAVLNLRNTLCMMGTPNWETNDDKSFFAVVANQAIEATYKARRAHATREVMLEDIVNTLSDYAPDADSQHLVSVAREMRERLLSWCRLEERARLINRPDAMDTQNRLTVFDFSGVEKDRDLNMVLTASLTDRVEHKFQNLPLTLPKVVGMDEAKVIFGKSLAAKQLADNVFRTARATGAWCLLASQHHMDLLDNEAVVSNTSMAYLMRHSSDHARVASAFELSPRATSLFRSLQFRAGHFAECLVKDVNQDRVDVLRYSPTAFDLWCDTSRAADMEFRNRFQKKHQCSVWEAAEKLARRYPHGMPKSKGELDEDFFETHEERKDDAA